MKIADLFVDIGIANGAKAKKELTGVQDGLKAAESSALLSKAAILGVIFGLERLTGFASQAGMDLNKFAIVTGLSTDQLQRWQYVARQYDVSAEEMTSTIRGLQQATTDMMLGKGMPEGAAALGIKMTRDPFNLLKQLAHAAKTLPPDVAGSLIKSFGISDGVFQMLRASNLELDKLSKKEIISKNEIEKLTQINKAWKDFWFSLRTMGIKFVAKEGLGAVTELANAFKALREGAEYVIKLTDKFQDLKLVIISLGAAIGIAFAPLTTIITGLLLLLSDIQKYREGKDSKIGKIVNSDQFKEMKESASKMTPGTATRGFFSEIWEKLKNPTATFPDHAMIPESLVTGKAPKPNEQSAAQMAANEEEHRQYVDKIKSFFGMGTTPNVTVNNYGVEHPKETGESSKKGIADAFRQMSAQAGGI